MFFQQTESQQLGHLVEKHHINDKPAFERMHSLQLEGQLYSTVDKDALSDSCLNLLLQETETTHLGSFYVSQRNSKATRGQRVKGDDAFTGLGFSLGEVELRKLQGLSSRWATLTWV